MLREYLRLARPFLVLLAIFADRPLGDGCARRSTTRRAITSSAS